MKRKVKETAQEVYGFAGTLEGVITAVRCFGASASDIIQIITTVFGFVLPMPVAIALRTLILTTSGYCLIDSIKKICPKLYRKLKTEKVCVTAS